MKRVNPATPNFLDENDDHTMRGLSVSTIRLQTYSKEPIKVVGTFDVQVSNETQSAVLPLVVVKGEGPHSRIAGGPEQEVR